MGFTTCPMPLLDKPSARLSLPAQSCNANGPWSPKAHRKTLAFHKLKHPSCRPIENHVFWPLPPQGAFGRGALSLTSFLTYVGLGLGFLGSGLALPFGLYILIVQRAPEPVLLDGVTPPSSSRQVEFRV